VATYLVAITPRPLDMVSKKTFHSLLVIVPAIMKAIGLSFQPTSSEGLSLCNSNSHVLIYVIESSAKQNLCDDVAETTADKH
jgi:hypothetical protein